MVKRIGLWGLWDWLWSIAGAVVVALILFRLVMEGWHERN